MFIESNTSEDNIVCLFIEILRWRFGLAEINGLFYLIDLYIPGNDKLDWVLHILSDFGEF